MGFNDVDIKVGGAIDVIKALQNYNTIIIKPNIVDNRNVLTQKMMSEKHTKYVIRWNYSLEDATINVPKDCIIEFTGGTIDKGTIVGNNTIMIYNKPIDEVCPAERQGTFIYNTTVADEEDITSESGQLKFKDRPATNGMGRKILRKNIVDGVNTLTQSMINQPNTIYVIKYDYELAENITIPANCVLEFDGGSISGAFTITGKDTKIDAVPVRIFGNDLTFAGSWDVKKSFADWFDGEDDADILQNAFDFAKGNSSSYNTIMVTCISREYIISKTVYIGAYVAFDANGSTIRPANPFNGQYMFVCNSIDADGWEISYPNNMSSSFGNFVAENSSHTGVCLLYCADSRKIHDIKARFFAKLIMYAGNYIDNKRIERVFNMYPSTALDYTSLDNEINTVAVRIGLGDNCSINQCAFSVYISNIANAHLDNYMGFVLVSNCSTVNITNAHTEAEAFLDVYGASVVNVTNFYGYVNKNRITIRTNGSYSTYPTLNLMNCYFYKLSDLGADFYTYRTIQGNGLITFNNVFGVISPYLGQDDKGQGMSIGLLSPVNNGMDYINPVYDVKCGDCRNLKKYNINAVDTLSRTVKFTANIGGTDFYVRVIYHAPHKYTPFYFDQYVLGLSTTDVIKSYSPNMPQSFPGYILRLEFGTDGTTFTHYIDFMTAGNRSSYIKLEKTQSGDYLVNNIPAKEIGSDYFFNRHVKIDSYENVGGNVKVKLSSDVTALPLYLPNHMNKGDVIITSDGVTLVRNTNASFHADGQTSGNTASRPTFKPVKGIQYYDTDLNKPIWWNGTAWVDATGATV